MGIIFILLAMLAGIFGVFGGFYIGYFREKKREVVGTLLALAGMLVFLISSLLVFVPDFFSK